jgi:hypothetical protein
VILRSDSFCVDEQGTLWFKGRLVVPKNYDLHRRYSMKFILSNIPLTLAAGRCIMI